ITDTDKIIGMPEQVGVPMITSPESGNRPPDNTISFKLNSSTRPDLFYARVLTAMGTPMWAAMIPGSASSFRLPDFPDFSHLPKSKRPEPYPGGGYQLVILGIDHPTLCYSNFSYSDLRIQKWKAFSASSRIISF
ncbi:MAG: hypothetical protein ABEN55_12305, partial [Bradymonadaceae bacterium]